MSKKLQFERRYTKRETVKRPFQITKNWPTPKDGGIAKPHAPAKRRRKKRGETSNESDSSNLDTELSSSSVSTDLTYQPVTTENISSTDVTDAKGTTTSNNEGETADTPDNVREQPVNKYSKKRESSSKQSAPAASESDTTFPQDTSSQGSRDHPSSEDLPRPKDKPPRRKVLQSTRKNAKIQKDPDASEHLGMTEALASNRKSHIESPEELESNVRSLGEKHLLVSSHYSHALETTGTSSAGSSPCVPMKLVSVRVERLDLDKYISDSESPKKRVSTGGTTSQKREESDVSSAESYGKKAARKNLASSKLMQESVVLDDAVNREEEVHDGHELVSPMEAVEGSMNTSTNMEDVEDEEEHDDQAKSKSSSLSRHEPMNDSASETEIPKLANEAKDELRTSITSQKPTVSQDLRQSKEQFEEGQKRLPDSSLSRHEPMDDSASETEIPKTTDEAKDELRTNSASQKPAVSQDLRQSKEQFEEGQKRLPDSSLSRHEPLDESASETEIPNMADEAEDELRTSITSPKPVSKDLRQSKEQFEEGQKCLPNSSLSRHEPMDESASETEIPNMADEAEDELRTSITSQKPVSQDLRQSKEQFEEGQERLPDSDSSPKQKRSHTIRHKKSPLNTSADMNGSLWRGRKITAVKKALPKLLPKSKTSSAVDSTPGFASGSPTPTRHKLQKKTHAPAKKKSPTKKTGIRSTRHEKSEDETEPRASSRSVTLWSTVDEPRQGRDTLDLDIVLECLKKTEESVYEETSSKICEKVTQKVCSLVRKDLHKSIWQVQHAKKMKSMVRKKQSTLKNLRADLQQKQKEEVELRRDLRKMRVDSGLDNDLLTLNTWLRNYDKLIQAWDKSKAANSTTPKYQWLGDPPQHFKDT